MIGFPTFVPGLHAHSNHEEAASRSGAAVLTETILREHPYLVAMGPRSDLEDWLRESAGAGGAPDQQLDANLSAILERVESRVIVPLDRASGGVYQVESPVDLPGDRGGILFRISNGEGPVAFTATRADLAETDGRLTIPVGGPGTTWALLTLEHVPDGMTTLMASVDHDALSLGAFDCQVSAPVLGRLKLDVLSDDTGEPTPAVVQLKWLLDGSLRVPDNALDFVPQFEAQGAGGYGIGGGRQLELPGLAEGDYWVIPGPLDMSIPPGLWRIVVLRGLEHLPETQEFEIESGRTTVVNARPKRWVDMAARGWISGDDHVHARLMSQGDADNLITWARAEDLHVVNILEMGNDVRTYFQQRAFGEDGRVALARTVLVPGQEDPRITELGHTIALNIREAVRDTSRYYLHDWFHERVHEVGGLFGYAHVSSGSFAIHRDLSLNAPMGTVDFVEILQFNTLGTTLYYDFLNLGCRLTASAGSDVPWGGTIGEVRVYAYPEADAPVGDGWFEALAKGNTFVTNGPMIEFTVDDAIPGDEIALAETPTTLRVKARAWGHPGRMMPTRLEIVQFGEVIRTATTSTGPDGALELEFELEADWSSWLAARAFASNGTAAHTTPIYLTRASGRSWNFDQVPALIDRRMSDLNEIEQLVDRARASRYGGNGKPRQGALTGAWFGNADFTRPRGTDAVLLPRQTWPKQGSRGGMWSARWRGAMTVPREIPATIHLHLDSSGASTLSVDGQTILSTDRPGEVSGSLTLEPDSPREVSLTYTNAHPPRSYLSLDWSADGIARRPVPAEWFSYREEDLAAFRYADGTRVETEQLTDQSEALLERVRKARRFYEDLRDQWSEEQAIRQVGPVR